MKVKRKKFPSPRSKAQSSKCSSGGVAVISLQVVDCQLWSLIFQIQRYYLVVIVTQEYCTLIPPTLGSAPEKKKLGCVLANSIADPWYWVNPIIFQMYLPYKRKHCKTTEYGIVLYWKRDYESMKRKCSGFAAGCIPSSFWIVIKGLAIYLWTQPIVWVNHVIYVSLCNILMCFASCLLI